MQRRQPDRILFVVKVGHLILRYKATQTGSGAASETDSTQTVLFCKCVYVCAREQTLTLCIVKDMTCPHLCSEKSAQTSSE